MPRIGDYRIISNGVVFKCEIYMICGFPWWKRARWKTCYVEGAFGFPPSDLTFKCLEDAQRCVAELKRNDEAEKRGFQVVEEVVK
jgi:hypothetical protein